MRWLSLVSRPWCSAVRRFDACHHLRCRLRYSAAQERNPTFRTFFSRCVHNSVPPPRPVDPRQQQATPVYADVRSNMHMIRVFRPQGAWRRGQARGGTTSQPSIAVLAAVGQDGSGRSKIRLSNQETCSRSLMDCVEGRATQSISDLTMR